MQTLAQLTQFKCDFHALRGASHNDIECYHRDKFFEIWKSYLGRLNQFLQMRVIQRSTPVASHQAFRSVNYQVSPTVAATRDMILVRSLNDIPPTLLSENRIRPETLSEERDLKRLVQVLRAWDTARKWFYLPLQTCSLPVALKRDPRPLFKPLGAIIPGKRVYGALDGTSTR